MDNTKGLCMGCMGEIGEEQVCHICGYDNSVTDNGDGLPVRTVLCGKYIVGKVIDSGGEGITYIGKEIESGKIVRIREYFPNDICSREPDGTVRVNRESSFSYNESLICFIELARTLSTLNGNPNLLDVIDIFEAGGTAYYVTESISGITLREFLMRNGGQLTWEQARSLFLPLLPVLSQLHGANIVHRGLSPETLLVGRDGKVRIIGFCIAAARTSRSDISARLFPGFAAIEQYGYEAQQGPWTDVYGIAATLFRTLVGNPPPEAPDRLSNDNMTIPAKLAQEVPKNVLASLAAALQVMPENRTKSIEKLKTELMADSGVAIVADKEEEEKKPTFFKQYGVLTIAVAATIILLIIALLIGKNWTNVFNTVTGGGNNISVPTSSEYIVNEENVVATVIDFKGKTCAEVLEYYEEQGFSDIEFDVIAKEYNDKYERGQIYKQTQKVGHEIEAEEKLGVYISLGSEMVSLPDFVEEETSYTDARIALLEMGFLPENIVTVAVTKLGEDADKVFKMSPKGGTKVSVESKVKLSYYKEIEDIEVQNFVGMNYNTEIKNNPDYSAYQFVIEEIYSEVYESGLVISQSIPKGTKIDNTESIKLTVSKGNPPAMPDLTNRLKSDAINLLTKRGIAYTVVEEYSDTISSGRVTRTNPRTGTSVTSTVVLYVSKGARPVSSTESKPESQVESTNSQSNESQTVSQNVSSAQNSSSQETNTSSVSTESVVEQ